MNNILKSNIIFRFISEWIMKRKIRNFEREFDRYYTGLLLGELYDAKIILLTRMKKNKELLLKNYLEQNQSVSHQLDNMVSKIKNSQ